jgi:hypothetical protein
MPELESMGSIPRAIAAVAMLLATAAGLGNLCLRTAAVQHWRAVDAFLLRLIVGLNLLGVIGVVLGTAGALRGQRPLWLLAGLLLLTAPTWWRRRVDFPAPPQGRSRRSGDAVCGAVLAACAALTLGPALCYPTGWDELVYHEVLPRRWLTDGILAVYADLPYSGFPSLGETLFWLMAPMESVIAPRLLVWTCWIAGLLCLHRVLRRYLAPPAAAVLVLAFTLNDTVLLISANCYVESILLMNVAGMLHAMGLWRRVAATGRGMRAVALGVLGAGAAGVKLTGAAVIAVPCLWFLGQAWSDRSRRRDVAGLAAVYLASAISGLLPFYVRPWLETGNPAYPFLCQWFTADAARLEMSRYHEAIGGYLYGVKTVAAFLDAPLLLAFRTDNYDGRFGWQLLGLLGLAILAVAAVVRARARRIVWPPMAVFVWLYVFWFATAQQARFAVPAILALTVLAALGLRRLHGRMRNLVLMTLAALTLVSVPWRNAGYYWCSWLAAVGRMSWTEYVDIGTRREHLPLVESIHAGTAADARLMLLFEHRGFYLPRRCVIGTPLFQAGPLSPPEQFRAAGPVMRALNQQQITHVVLAKAPEGPDHLPGSYQRQKAVLDGLRECVEQGLLQPAWESDGYLLLAVP